MIIQTIPESEATGLVAESYAADRADLGYVPLHTKAMNLNPEALQAFEQLTGAIGGALGTRRYRLVTLAAARGARSAHCRLAHGRASLALFDEDQLTGIALDYRSAGLSDAEVAMMEFAEKVSRDASSMTDDDSRRLREHGFSDTEIVNIALAAAVRNYYSRAVQALAIEVEELPGLSASLHAALVSGL
ncbi:carboxymuconolactone decarboxylase family protein [Glaciihabitans arcticus]